MRRPSDAAKLAVVLVLATAVPVQAADKRDPIDPEAGSPSGFVYELPADTAREDAAPVGAGGSGGSGSSRVPIHSDNGFGTSSQVPGVSNSGSKAAGGSGDGKGGGPRIGLPLGGSGGDAGDGQQATGAQAGSSTGGVPVGEAAGPLSLLALAGALGGVLAFAARRRRLVNH